MSLTNALCVIYFTLSATCHLKITPFCLMLFDQYLGRGLAGHQGQLYGGTGCFHRRKIIYGSSPEDKSGHGMKAIGCHFCFVFMHWGIINWKDNLFHAGKHFLLIILYNKYSYMYRKISIYLSGVLKKHRKELLEGQSWKRNCYFLLSSQTMNRTFNYLTESHDLIVLNRGVIFNFLESLERIRGSQVKFRLIQTISRNLYNLYIYIYINLYNFSIDLNFSIY